MLPTPIRFDPSLERSHDDAPSELHLSAAVYRHPTTSLSLGDPEALKAAKTLSPGKALHPHGPADQFFGSEAQVPGARTSARGPGWKRRRLTKKNNQEGSEFRGSLKKPTLPKHSKHDLRGGITRNSQVQKVAWAGNQRRCEVLQAEWDPPLSPSCRWQGTQGT